MISFEFADDHPSTSNYQLEYEFHFELNMIHIKVISMDKQYPAYWQCKFYLTDHKIGWLPVHPQISQEAQEYMQRIYDLRVFW